MVLQRILKIAETLENPEHPLLGPNLEGLSFFGLWQYESNWRILYNMLHILSVLFVVTQFIEFYLLRNNLPEALMNFSLTGLSTVTVCKTLHFILNHSKWTELVQMISKEEISAIQRNDLHILTIMGEYKKYSRLITFLYWALTVSTGIVAAVSPALKYASLPQYRKDIANGIEPYPQILSSWLPFNKNQMPGYLGSLTIHYLFLTIGAGILAVYDANAVTLMTFLKGQAKIIKYKCARIFGEDTALSEKEVLNRIRECHRQHNYIKTIHEQINSLLSPVQFLYVLVASITICCSVVQLSMDVSSVQKLWAIEYGIGQAFQLFLYCWHSNEVTLAMDAISSGVFESKWWRSTVRQRKMMVVLMGQVNEPCVLTAGPFTVLSVATFVDIIKRTYSFYTLITQMQDN